ncbi:hypothetical protein E4U52_004133 [Claviceps spartinae]|nr:hypothetical protein E4U52_004133 [Claviceps spartinae]
MSEPASTSETRGWVATAFIGLGILALCVDNTTVAVARLELRSNVADRDKIELLQIALHTDFDARCRMANIPEDNYP